MGCYECALRDEAVAAVAVCQHCGVGLCLEHLAVAEAHRVGGTRFGCPHDLARASARRRTPAAVAAPSGPLERAAAP